MALAVLLCLATFELGVRVLLDPPRYHRGAIEFDTRFGFRGVPKLVREGLDEDGSFELVFNGSGLRGPELPTQPPGVDRRIAFVGDSFLVGEAVRDEQLVTELTRRGLAARGLDAAVFNLSGVDYGTAQQLLMLRAFAPRLGPTDVVLFLYPANDLINNALGLAGASTVSAGDYIRPYLVEEAGELSLRYRHPVRAWLRRVSRGFAELESRVLGLGADAGLGWLAPFPPNLSVSERLQRGLAPREDLEIYRPHHPGHVWERAWRSTESLLRAFRDECQSLGARLLVVVVPNVHEVIHGPKSIRLDVATQLISGRTLDRMLDWNLPRERLAEFLAAAGIEARFLLEPLRGAASAGVPVYGRDEHLSPAGHALAAEPVLAWLLGEPPPAPEPASSRQTSLLPAADPKAAPLDFASDRQLAHLGDGWLQWEPRREGGSWGWVPGPRALVVLAAAAGELVVRGEVLAETPLPVRGFVSITGLPAHSFQLSEPGDFEVRVPAAPKGAIESVTSGGYVAVEFAARVVAGVRVHEIGFEAPPDA